MPDEPPLARRDVIASRLAQGHSVVAATLAHEFAVSEDAIRRDLRALADDGLCRRVYGGALPISPGSVTLAARAQVSSDRKLALARTAARTIQRREFLFLDSSSSNLALAGLLPEDHELTVATNSLDIGAALLRRQDLKLILIGGPVDPSIGGCVDGAAVQSVSLFNIDRCFIGTCSVSATTGVGAFHSSDATFKRALIEVSQHCSTLITTDKFDVRAPYRVAPLAKIESIIVEHDAPVELLTALTQAGVSIIQAEPAR
jgi:DeoR/GlpR family transcriptional regulator of sugar metabolism